MLFARNPKRNIINIVLALTAFRMPNRHFTCSRAASQEFVLALLWSLCGRRGEASAVSSRDRVGRQVWRYDHGVCRLPLLWPFAGSVCLPTITPNPGLLSGLVSNLVTATSFGAAASCIMAGFIGDRFGTHQGL